jgi:pimeloyl-ACP methyl ester carboxylesterase
VGERFKPRLAAYPGPSLLINGEYDLFFRPTEPGFARVAANPRRVLIRRATHLVPFDQPDAFADVVRTFARSIAAADR